MSRRRGERGGGRSIGRLEVRGRRLPRSASQGRSRAHCPQRAWRGEFHFFFCRPGPPGPRPARRGSPSVHGWRRAWLRSVHCSPWRPLSPSRRGQWMRRSWKRSTLQCSRLMTSMQTPSKWSMSMTKNGRQTSETPRPLGATSSCARTDSRQDAALGILSSRTPPAFRLGRGWITVSMPLDSA